MINSISGTLSSIGDNYVVIQVSGIGLRVNVAQSTIVEAGTEGDLLMLHTTLLIRDDAPVLYGFPTAEGKRLFDLLQDVSGVGPRLSLDMLDAMSPDEAAMAIVSGDLDRLSGVKGIGARTAGRIVVDLQSKLQKDWEASPSGIGVAHGDLIAALQALGYSRAEVQEAVAGVGDLENSPLEEQLRQALQSLVRE